MTPTPPFAFVESAELIPGSDPLGPGSFLSHKSPSIGFHSAFDWFSRECEYECRPVSPEEKRDRLADAIETASRVLEMAVKEAHQMTTVKRVA
jgi:hypothetical protein